MADDSALAPGFHGSLMPKKGIMTLRDELRQFMVACEVILDRSVSAEDLHHIEYELLQYYLCKVTEKFPQSPGSIH